MYLTENQLKIEKIIIGTIAALLVVLVVLSNSNLILKSSHMLLLSTLKPLVFIGIILCSTAQAIIFAKVNKVGSAVLSVTVGSLTVGIYTIIQAAMLLSKKQVKYKSNEESARAVNKVKKASAIVSIFAGAFLVIQTFSVVQAHQNSDLHTWEDVLNFDFSQDVENDNKGDITVEPEIEGEEESDIVNQYDNGDLARQPSLFSDKWWSDMQPRTIIATLTEIYVVELYLIVAYIASGLFAITIAKNGRIKRSLIKATYAPFTLLFEPIKGLFKSKK